MYENDTNVSVVDPENNPHGLPPHSITCVVEGGSDTDIAKAILYHKGIGCYTNGSKEVSIIDRNDYVNKVRFYRPAYVDIYVNLKLKNIQDMYQACLLPLKPQSIITFLLLK